MKTTEISQAAAAMGRKGGSAKSEAKTAAVRANGAKGGRPKSPFDSTFHRDGSVTVWDVHNQGWIRTSHPSDSLLATLSGEERAKVIAHTA